MATLTQKATLRTSSCHDSRSEVVPPAIGASQVSSTPWHLILSGSCDTGAPRLQAIMGHKRILGAALLALACCIGACPVLGVTTELTNSPGTWSIAGHWNNGVPGNGDTVYIGGDVGVSPATCNLSGATVGRAGEVWIGQGTKIGRLNVTTSQDGTFTNVYVSYSGDAYGVLNVDGSKVITKSGVYVSGGGNGFAIATNGGVIEIYGVLNVAPPQGRTGVAYVVDSPSKINVYGTTTIGGGGNGSIVATNGGVVNINGSLYISPSDGGTGMMYVSDSAQINMTNNATFWQISRGFITNLDFANKPTGGKVALTNNASIRLGGAGNVPSIVVLAVDQGTTERLKFSNLYMGDSWSQGSSNTFNVIGATVDVSYVTMGSDVSFCYINVTTGGVMNVGSDVVIGGTRDVLITLDSLSQFNMTNSGCSLQIKSGTFYDLDYANTPTAGRLCITNNGNLRLSGAGNAPTFVVVKVDEGTGYLKLNNLYMGDSWGQNQSNTFCIVNATVDVSTATMGTDVSHSFLSITNGVFNDSGNATLRGGGGRTCVVQGSGRFAVGGTLSSDARFTADGGTLTVSYATLSDEAAALLMADGTQEGWYAINAGKLTLPGVSVSGSDVSWGDLSTDATVDRVNSLRFKNWTGVTAGIMTNSVIATNNSSFNGYSMIPVGVWDINTNNSALKFTSVDMDFRYDDLMAASLGLGEVSLRAFHWTGSVWDPLSCTVDTVNNRISATGVTSLGLFVVAPRLDVENPNTATGITATAAWVSGQLLCIGSTNAYAYAYYGLTNGITNAANWATNALVGTELPVGTAWGQLTNLAPDSLYFYRCFATNAHLQTDWATQSISFLTASAGDIGNLWIKATDPAAGERGPDTGTFTIYRPDGATNGALPVNYTVSGNAQNGNDYLTLSGSTVIPEGAPSVNVIVTPIYDDNFTESSETVTVTIATGGYKIHPTSNTADVVIDPTASYDDFAFRMKVQTRGYTVPGTVTGFPVLVTFSNNVGGSGFYYRGFQSPGAYDLRFADSNMSQVLPYEIEKWDTNGQSLVWVKVPYVDSTNTYFWAYWGNIYATNSAPYCTTNGSTWGTNCMGVWHMNTTNAADSSARGHNCVVPGGAVTGATAVIGIGNGFNRDSGSYLRTPDSADFDLPGDYTISVWAWDTGRQAADHGIMGTYNNGFIWAINNDQLGFWDEDWYGGPSVSDNTWHHLVVTKKGTGAGSATYYVDGQALEPFDGGAGITGGQAFEFGTGGPAWHYWWDGILDEARVESVRRGSNWLWACYSNQCPNSTFLWYYPVGAEIDNGIATNIGANTASLQCRLVQAGSSNCDVKVYFGTNDGLKVFGDWASNVLVGTYLPVGTYTGNVTSLAQDTLYYYRAYATNGAAETDWAELSDTFLTAAGGGAGNVSLSVSDSSASETGPDNGVFVISRPSAASATSGPLTVYFTLGGTALCGTDYQSIPTGSVTLAAGVSSTNIIIAPVDDNTQFEGDETVTIVLRTGNYVIGTASGMVTITDNDAPNMQVFGTNLALIADGDISPEVPDGTDFGITEVGVTNYHTFTITNAAATPLSLTGTPAVVISGSSAFWVSSQPVATNLGLPSGMKISFTNFTSLSGMLTNFPALVAFSNNVDGSEFDYGDFLSTNGYDLRFWTNVACSGTEVSYEVEQWNTAGVSYVWVKVPLFSNNCSIWASWGETATQPNYCTNGDTWTEGYLAVYHFDQTNGVEDLTDSTSNRYHCTQSGNPTSVVGKISYAEGFSDNNYLNTGSGIPDYPSVVTESAWIKTTEATAIILAKRHAGGYPWPTLMLAGNKAVISVDDDGYRNDIPSTTSVNNGEWRYVTGVKSGTTYSIYVDGVLEATETDARGMDGSGDLHIGHHGSWGDYFNGQLDEIRVANVVHSSNWIWACWMNTASNDFSTLIEAGGGSGVTTSEFTVAFGPTSGGTKNATVSIANNNPADTPYTFAITGSGGAGAPVLANNIGASNVTATSALMCGSVVAGSPTPNGYFFWGPTDGGTNKAAWSNVVEMGSRDGSFATNITGLATGKVYFYRTYASNVVGESWVTDTQAWMGKPIATGKWYLVSVPVQWGVTASNNLDSILGLQVASGLDGGGGPDSGDILWVQQGGNWVQYWLAPGDIWKNTNSPPTDASLVISNGVGFWVRRLTSSASTNMVFVGRAHTNSTQITFNTNTWTVFGWPYSPRAQSGWGFSGAESGWSWDTADNIIGEYNGSQFAVYLRVGGTWCTRGTSKATTVALEPGRAYYYFKRGTSSMQWTAPK